LPDPSRRGLWQWKGETLKPYAPVDVVFPVLHGTFG
jgi:D-alanine-D-alanine ligase-like ATP-grasp enzyme